MVSYLYRSISSPPILVATVATCPEKKRYEPISTAPTQMSRGAKYGCKPPLFLVPTRWFHHFPKRLQRQTRSTPINLSPLRLEVLL